MGDLLAGKVAIVTGVAGDRTGPRLRHGGGGAKVVVNDIGVQKDGTGGTHEPADEVVAQIREQGGEAVASYGSVADFEAARGIIQTALDAFGRLDILVNNAGIFRDILFHQMTEDDWDAIVAVHLKGTFNTCRHAVPLMMSRGTGALSTRRRAVAQPEGRSAYGAAKGGIVSLTWDLAWELQNYDISVNSIAPMALTGSSVSSGPYHDLVTGAAWCG